ncbi:MAG TPA: hypothetical protein VHW45_19050 [Candidatus Sulfotelmatobacter sp.]|nr:hypothetical protein [Candidatus Sulfotelmatobacter sp.]
MATIASRTALLTLPLVLLALSVPSVSGRSAHQTGAADLTVHEWGTFTSVADRNGRAVGWELFDRSTDLPEFVEHLRSAETKAGLQGTVRMETPVLYFYSPTETTVSVSVSFARGLITEWYPHADRIKPELKKDLLPTSLYDHNFNGSIAWNAVTVSPGLAANFPHDEIETHYYAARETSSAPVIVNTRAGTQQEKFLFYRGVSVTPVPVSAQSAADGKIVVKNIGEDVVPAVILFERRGNRMGYRLGGALQGETSLDPPELTSNMESLSQDLENVLIAQGLNPDEARAMIATWESSWFEEGSRLLYIVPTRFVNSILPLSIIPPPSRIVRAFVGRLELITPATEQAVETALANRDRVTITKYGRFLGPILNELKRENPGRSAEIDRELLETYDEQLVETPAK